MNKADLLMATLRQLTTANLPSHGGVQNAVTAKGGKDKAGHFQEQLRLISQGMKQAAQPLVEAPDSASVQTAEAPAHLAEVARAVPARSKDRTNRHNDGSQEPPVAANAAPPPEWSGSDSALSAVLSKLDQAATAASPEGDAVVRAEQSQMSSEQRVLLSKLDEFAKNVTADEMPDQRFTLAADAAETRGSESVKVVVREQETHFEPVSQLTLLQKIADRVATDLSTTSAPAGANTVDVTPPDIQRVADKPVKILTVQLDPPDLGTVTVRMRLTGDAVEIHVSAERYETTQMLRQERDALTDRMQAAGYSFDIASIDHNRVGDVGQTSGQMSSRSDQQQSSQQQQGGLQINGGNSERQPGDAQAGARQNRQGHEQSAERVARNRNQDVVPDRTGDALYL